MIVIIDYDLGNLYSVSNAFKRIGVETVISRDKDVIRKADGIVLPGVGTFLVAMKNLERYDLIDVLTERKEAGVPFLGICLGMQVLFDKGYEVEEINGLGFINGEVKLIECDQKIPHMGWNQLHFVHNNPIIKNINEGDDVYFVHSFMAYVKNEEDLVCDCQYGNINITALVAKDNVIGCQFHPEKSGVVGKKILLAFKEMVLC